MTPMALQDFISLKADGVYFFIEFGRRSFILTQIYSFCSENNRIYNQVIVFFVQVCLAYVDNR